MTELTKEPNKELIIAISDLLLKNGMKATTMDFIASSLSMSKRTLYEIFNSKRDMIVRVVAYWQEQRRKDIVNIFNSSATIMEALVRSFAYHKKMMSGVNVDFIRDMDRNYPEVRELFNAHDTLWVKQLMIVIRKGIEQGVFRTDVNYPIVLRMMRIQMESLKRMEEVFPEGIEISDAFDTIYISFLRSIASLEGMRIIDNFLLNNQEYSNSIIIETKS